MKATIKHIQDAFDNFISTEYLSHFHGSGMGPTTPTTVPGQATTIQQQLDNDLKQDSQNLDDLYKKVPDHQSKNISIN